MVDDRIGVGSGVGSMAEPGSGTMREWERDRAASAAGASLGFVGRAGPVRRGSADEDDSHMPLLFAGVQRGYATGAEVGEGVGDGVASSSGGTNREALSGGRSDQFPPAGVDSPGGCGDATAGEFPADVPMSSVLDGCPPERGGSGSSAGGNRQRNIQRVRSNANEVLTARQSTVRDSRLFLSAHLTIRIIEISLCVVVLWLSRDEKPDVPLRLWVVGYMLHGLLVMPWLYYRLEYGNRSLDQLMSQEPYFDSSDRIGRILESSQGLLDLFYFAWFIAGNEWLYSSYTSAETAPQLYQLTLFFLIIGYLSFAFPLLLCLTVCCCLPCVIVVLAAMEDPMSGRGANERTIESIPKEKYMSHGEGIGGRVGRLEISGEDAVCSICLAEYEDGASLRLLSCDHHFHAQCVDQWLRINACCPLCKKIVGTDGTRSDDEDSDASVSISVRPSYAPAGAPVATSSAASTPPNPASPVMESIMQSPAAVLLQPPLPQSVAVYVSRRQQAPTVPPSPAPPPLPPPPGHSLRGLVEEV